MSSVRTLKIRRSAPATEAPINDLILGSVRSGSVKTAPDSTVVPLEVPFDRQCIIRFPEEVAPVIRNILRDPATTDVTEVIRVSLESDLVDGHAFRVFSVSVVDQPELAMRGILVDLPTYVESYKTANAGATITKSSDVSQMLVCFLKKDFEPVMSPEVQKTVHNLMHPSGLTPPTGGIRNRKFRAPPSKEDVQNLRSAEDVIDNTLSGGALEWVVETQVPEEEAVNRAINEPENVWMPTEEIMAQLRRAGCIDAHGDLIEDEEMEDLDTPLTGGGKGLVFTRRS